MTIEGKSPSAFKVGVAIILAVIAIAIWWLLPASEQASDKAVKETSRQAEWALKDSAGSNLTSMDPVRMIDAFSINVLSHVFEGLVAMQADGQIVPALAREWEVSEDGKLWTFHLQKGVKFHKAAGTCDWKPPSEVTSKDVVYSLTRGAVSSDSFYKWAFADIVEGVGEADFEKGIPISGISSPDPYTVEIRLARPFPLLNRLVTVVGWVYPSGILEACGKDYVAKTPVGTGAYYLKDFIPDDRIELSRYEGFRSSPPGNAPKDISISIFSDSVASLEAFKSNRLDVVELSLGTLESGRRFAKENSHQIVSVTANYLDYLVLNNSREPFNDIRVRKALNGAINREGLAKVLSGTVTPAYGFVPPSSPAYRGMERIRKKGFQYQPQEAKKLLQEYLAEKNLKQLDLELTIDAGELPENIGQYVQAQLQENLGIRVKLVKKTWPELLQFAFGGNGDFYRFWWNIVTPSEDIYFLFYFPGQGPPNGLNLSFYESNEFVKQYHETFSILDFEKRMPGVQSLEDRMILDAVAVPLLHKKFFFLVRNGVQLPINGFLRKHYFEASRTPE